MKKILAVLLALVFVVTACFVVTAGASNETYALASANETWVPNASYTVATVTVEEIDGATVFSGSMPFTWPDTICNYSPCITVPVEDYAINYDISVEDGQVNIMLIFGAYTFTISNTAFSEFVFSTDSGDILPGNYKGSVLLSELVAASSNYMSIPFDKGVISNGKLTFTGLQVYSVNGGVLTVRKLELAPVSSEPDPGNTGIEADLIAAVGEDSKKAEFNVHLDISGIYTAAGDKITVIATAANITHEGGLSVVDYEFRYDAGKVKLTNAVNSDGSLDCIVKLPGTKWENIVKVSNDEAGLINASVIVAENDTMCINDGDITLAFEFEILEEAAEEIGFYVPTANVYATDWDNPTSNIDGNGSYAIAKRHTHFYNVNVVEPTCTKGGYTTHTCECGDTFTDNYTAPIGHNYVATVTEPTYLEQGYTTHTCTHCGDFYIDNYVERAQAGVASEKAELIEAVLTEEEKAAVENGAEFKTYIEVENIKETISPETLKAIEAAIGKGDIGMILDINMFKQIGDGAAEEVHTTQSPVTVVVNIPDELISEGREYKIARMHDGEIELLQGVFDPEAKTFTFETDKFSVYSLVYSETYLLGDIDGDGKISARDYQLLKRAVLKTYNLDETQKLAGDIDGDGKISARDYQLLKRAVLGTYVIAK